MCCPEQRDVILILAILSRILFVAGVGTLFAGSYGA